MSIHPGLDDGRVRRCVPGRYLTAAGLLLASLGADAVTPGTQPVLARCATPAPSAISCDLRLTDPAPVLSVRATVESTALPVLGWEPYPTGRSVTAVLVLVDSSAGARPAGLAVPTGDVRTLLEAPGRHLHFGLAVFDSELRAAVPVGEDREAVGKALDLIKPTERPTELYRNALEAVRQLEATPADRRALVIFSDGVAEDRAYSHQDVVSAAVAGGVTVHGFGYARSLAQTVALQTLRRLSEETGGLFLAPEAGAERIAPPALAESLRLLESGGTVRVDLSPARAAGLFGTVPLRLTVQTAQGEASAMVPIDLPRPAPAAGTLSSPAPAGPAAPPAPALRPPVPQAAGDFGGWGLLLLLVLVTPLALVAWRRSRPGRREPGAARGDSPQVFGYLVSREHPGQDRFPLTRPTVRIGRQRDNDLVLEDTSVSRHHAEVRRGRDGALTLVDLDSLNGVFVNERQVKSAVLAEGDAVEIGDVRLAFTRRAEGPIERGHGREPLEKTLITRPEEILGLSPRD
jgi:hypothetical protein